MNEISVVSTFELDNKSQSELAKISSTFSILNIALEDINKQGNVFLQNIKNLNTESSSLQKNISDIREGSANLVFTMTLDDRDNVLGIAQELQNEPVPTPVPNVPPPSSFESEKSTFELFKERVAEIQSVLANLAEKIQLDTLFELYKIWLENSEAIKISITQILFLLGAVATAIALLPISAKLGIFLAISLVILKMSGHLDQFLNATIEGIKSLGSLFLLTEEEAQKVADSLKNAPELPPLEQRIILSPGFENVIDALPPELLKELDEAEIITPELDKKIQDFIKNNQNLINEVQTGQEEVSQYGEDFGRLEGAVAMLGNGFVAGAGAQSQYVLAQDRTNQAVARGEEVLQGAGVAAAGYVEETENASKALDLFGVFVGKVGAQISETFSDFLFEGLKGNFDNFEDLFDDLLDTLLRSFTDFASAIITNPIRVSLEGSLTGDAGGGGIGGLFKGIGDALGPLGDLFKTGGPLDSIGGFFDDLFAEGGPLGFLSGIGNFLGPIGSAISAVASIAIPLIGGLLKKTPRLDLDFDQLRDNAGKSLGIAAQVFQFLDEDLFNNEIFNRSVSRQAGLGLRGELPNVIREAIEGQINAIQDIINQLPADIAAQLNESLLNTSVDIESEVKGDRLLEFDETKNISEKFQQFINGDLQARFLFSIREFFVGAFESLGVLSDAAQSFIDGEFEKFQGLSREERIEAGKEFLQDFQTLTDAFNVLNNNGADSIGSTVNSIKNLSSSLEFDGVPSIEELDAGLEELINAAELDPDIIQDYLDLRNAILEAQRAILSSIQSIISSISSLNSIIVDGGGSAFDLTGFINEGLDSVTGLLGQDGLSVEDTEELLGLGTGFLDQLIAEEQAAFQAQLQATQQAAEAAAEAQRAAIRSQINGLEEERDLIEENFDARIEALEEELRLAEEFARLTESIQQTLNSIILGPDSVFTAVERLNIVQGDIASLQSELAATTDPSKQLELAAQLEDSLSTLFDLAGEAFGVNSPEFTAIFSQVTGGLNDLIDLTGNRERSVEEINAEIESLNIERNQQLEAIDAQIASLNDQLSSIQAQNVEATFQASDRVQELAEFFRNEYIALLEERFEQLGEVSETGFTEELDALNSLVNLELELGEKIDQGLQIEDSMLITLRSIEGLLAGAPSFREGTGGFVDFGRGTLAFLHGREAVVPESQFTPFREFSPASGDMNVNINVNVDGGSSGTVDTLATNIEDMLVRSIRQGGKLRSAVQEAGARRLN